ncbi:endosomal transmembrane epsin interactor 1 isoform X3 [Serinus canaria]|uniref:endosomal transmembrane epsin interactor 1 isoform X3 n=1 Tax=Serinus canaria TaxID=9135 RepID=UPI0021CCFB1A|nr:endosomal transmembrane epsin interactor 1 isoform X3 [Serinus canaria]
MVLPGSCCPFPGLVPLPQAGPLRPGAPRRHRPCRPCPLLLFRSLLGLGLLQTGLGCALVALCFGALSLSSAPQVKNACPLWAGSSAILCGILGLTTWKKPMRLLVNLFVLLCMISFMLNVTGLILGCQGIQFVSGVPRCNLMDMDENKTCFCCEELHPTTCTEAKAVLKLYHVKSCRAAHLLLKDEFEIEGEDRNLDPDDFVPPVPPPSYFATFNSCTPPSHSTPVSDVISLHYIYVTRIRGVEVYCPLDPPPPYETVCSLKSSEQGGVLQINGVEEVDSGEVSDRQSSQAEEIEEPSSRVSLSSSNASCVPAGVNRRAFHPLLKCSKSDPVLLHCQLPPGTVLSSETATLDVNPPNAVTLRKSSRARASRGRPQSLIDYQSYMDTKRRVAWILEQSCSMSPDIRDLVENIKSVLKSDEKHMAEAVTSATFLEQVMTTPDQQDTSLRVHVLPSRLHPGLLHLESCGDLSTFTTEGEQLAERRIQRAEHERPHSVIGVVRETVL